jgi:pimeloyl-ACP methyl ester carboxylesterase
MPTDLVVIRGVTRPLGQVGREDARPGERALAETREALSGRAVSSLLISAGVSEAHSRWDTRLVKPGPVQYAWNGDNALAYQIVGDGPVDLLVYFGWMSNLDVQWESPYLAGFLQRLTEHARLIITDRRGWGCSERFSPTDVPPLETLADDLQVILDAAGSRRAVVLATAESGMIAQFFAAAHADRTAGLILVDSFVSWVATPETPWMNQPQWWEEFFDQLRSAWGVTWLWGTQAVADEPRELEWYLRYQRSCAAPGAAIAEQRRFMTSSTIGVLDAIHVPTLVLSMLFGDTCRYLASRIAGRSAGEARLRASAVVVRTG